VLTEELLTSSEAYGLKTATPVQRMICRVADGKPLGSLWNEPEVQKALGGARPPERVPRLLVVLAAIRGAKSTIMACRGARAALSCDVDALSPGDELLVPLVATEKKTAQQLYAHAMALFRTPALRGRVVRETAEGLWARHDSGRPVEISVMAMSRSGSTLTARWVATAGFDEAPRMIGSSEGVRNLDDSMNALEGRVRDDGLVFWIGSPWAPWGPVYDVTRDRFGRPAEDVVVIRATGPMLNPQYWTPERCAQLERFKPSAYRMNVLGEFADADEAMIPSESVMRAIERSVTERPRRKGVEYVAAMDPATRGNAWTLVVLGNVGKNAHGEAQYEVAVAEEWRGNPGTPLRPRAVLEEIRGICSRYGVTTVLTDQAALDAYADIGDSVGIGVAGMHVLADDRWEMCELVRLVLVEERLSLLDVTNLRADLLRVEKRPTPKGSTIRYPTSGDGRHCDFVPALGLCMKFPPGPPRDPNEPEKGPPRKRATTARPRTYDTGALVRQLTR
jgi:hypothetical protein